jgi:hypothetical protein
LDKYPDFLLLYIYRKDPFPDIVGSSYNFQNSWILEKGEGTFSIFFDFKGTLSIIKKLNKK